MAVKRLASILTVGTFAAAAAAPAAAQPAAPTRAAAEQRYHIGPLKRVELQVNPAVLARTSLPDVGGARTATGSAASVDDDKPAAAADPILADPNEAYRTEVMQALKDAMLAHSSALNIGGNEWLTIAAKGNDDRPRLAPADSGSNTRVIRLKGSDLADFLAGKITRDEALSRIEVK